MYKIIKSTHYFRSYSLPNYHHLPVWNEEPMDQDSRVDNVLDLSIPVASDDDDADDEGNDSDYRPDVDCAIEYLVLQKTS